MVNPVRAVLCALVGLAALVAAAPRTEAAPPPVPLSGRAVGDAALVGVSLSGSPPLAGVRLVSGESAASSTTTPRASSVTQNVADAPTGFGIVLLSNDQTAPPDNAASETGALTSASAQGISTGAITYSNEAHWAGDGSCVSDVLANTTSGTAGVAVSPTGAPDILSTGAASTSTVVRLVSTGGTGLNRAVQSQAVGTLTGLSLLGGAVTVDVDGDATLTATAAGTPGGAEVSYDPPVVSVTSGSTTTVVEIDEPVSVDLGADGAVTVSLNTPTQQADPAGFGAGGSVTAISVSVRLGPAGTPLGSASLGLLQLGVAAAIAAGGVDCPPPAPAVDAPADGAELDDATPTFSGTGTPGATVNLIVDGATISNVAADDSNGGWAFTPITPLPAGAHTVSATQTLNGATSPESAENGFTVASDTQAPTAPVITAPADGSRTRGNTPVVQGAGEPGATVTVRVNGEEVGTAAVDGNGNWGLPPPNEPVPDGRYEVSATQTDQAGNTSPADEVVFTIDTRALPPVITEPEEGSTTNATPTIGGTGEPGATVTVRVDGAVVGTATVQQNGTWKLILTEPLAEGEHTVSARQTDLAGNISSPDEVGFGVEAEAIPPVTEPSDSDARLAATGGPPLVAVVLAAAMLVTGAMPLTLRGRIVGR